MADDTNKPFPPGWQPKTPISIPKNEIGVVKGKVSLRNEDFNTLIKSQGVRVKVYRTVTCPNIKSIDAGEHEIDCKICSNGFIDRKPIQTFAYIQGQTLQADPLQEGYYDNYKISGSFLSGIELQYFTLVELLDHTDIFFQRIKRQQGSVDVLKYKAKCINLVIDQNGVEYLPSSDFDLDANGSLRWKANKGPNIGTIYSIHYDFNMQFRAIKAQHTNRFAQVGEKSPNVDMVKLPEQWELAREYLVQRTDFDGNELSPNLIRDPDESA